MPAPVEPLTPEEIEELLEQSTWSVRNQLEAPMRIRTDHEIWAHERATVAARWARKKARRERREARAREDRRLARMAKDAVLGFWSLVFPR